MNVAFDMSLRWQCMAMRRIQPVVAAAWTASYASRLTVIALMLIVAVSLGGSRLARGAEPDARAREGERIAQMVCSACHIVASKQERRPILENRSPDFCAMANRPDSTTRSLAHFIIHTHWDEKSLPLTMPNPMLTSAQATQVAHYIVSLRGHCTFGS